MKKEKKVFNGKLLKVYQRQQQLPNGYQMQVEYIKHPGAVLVIPVFADNKLLLIRQYRPALDKYIWEFCAGTLEKNEAPLRCAQRELIEETGYQAKSFKKIGLIAPVPGYATEIIHLFLARQLTKLEKQAMPDEVISEKIFSLKQVKQMVVSGKIIDAKTICGLQFLALV